jgi:hypothetical protein
MKGSFMLLNKFPRLALASSCSIVARRRLRHAVFAGGWNRGMHQILNFTFTLPSSCTILLLLRLDYTTACSIDCAY